MKEDFKELYEKLVALLEDAPDEDECTDIENEMYADMTNLKNSMENAGYEDWSQKKG